MKKNQFLMISIFISLLIIIGIVLFAMDGAPAFQGLNLLLIIFIVLIAIISLIIAYKKYKEVKEGQPAEDEMSKLLKYKAGYYAFLASMYLWLFIFLFREKFDDVELMLGGGILMSALISFIAKYLVKRGFNA